MAGSAPSTPKVDQRREPGSGKHSNPATERSSGPSRTPGLDDWAGREGWESSGKWQDGWDTRSWNWKGHDGGYGDRASKGTYSSVKAKDVPIPEGKKFGSQGRDETPYPIWKLAVQQRVKSYGLDVAF